MTYYERNREKILAYKRKYHKANKAKRSKYAKEYRNRPEVKERNLEYLREWRANNPNYKAPNEDISRAKYNASDKGKATEAAYTKKYKARRNELRVIRMEDPEYAAKQKEWHKNHRQKPEVIARRRKLDNIRSKKDSVKKSLRSLFYNCLKRFSTDGKIYKSREYGINYSDCMLKLEKEAKEMGYSIKELRFNNYQIDHIIPMSMYDMNDFDDIKSCFSPYNLRWLDGIENAIKGNYLRPQDIEVIKTLPKEIYPQSWNGNIPTI